MDIEQIVTNLILNAGQGKSKLMEAISLAQKGEFEKAESLTKEAEELISKAHNFQTELLQKEAAGESDVEFSLILIHGQDHLMNSITVKDLAKGMINLYKEVYSLKNK